MEMDIDKIMSLLPHRYPFLLVDRVLEIEQGSYGRELSTLYFCPLVHLSQSVHIHTAYSPGVMWFFAIPSFCRAA